MTSHATIRPAGHPACTSGPISLEEALGLIVAHEQDAARSIVMIPSENMLPPLARLPLLSDLYCRYFFNDAEDPGDWRFPAARDAAALETRLTIPLLCQLAKASHVNVRPISGLSAMTLVLAALGGPPGSPVAVLSPQLGGHYATAALAARLGLRPVMITGSSPHAPDLDQLSALLARHRPPLLYLDQSHGLVPFDVPAIMSTARQASPGTRVHADVSHWMGLTLGGALPSPLDEGADSFGGSTHKTFPGPQKGIIATRDADVARLLRQAQPHVISSHHFGATCALGLALALFASRCPAYPRAIIANARSLGCRLADEGLTPEGVQFGYSKGHQLWVRTAPHGISASDAAGRLHRAGIRVNFLTDLPGITEPALRIGLNEPTWLGLQADDIPELATIMTAAVFATRPSRELAARTHSLRCSLHASPMPGPLRDLASLTVHAAFGGIITMPADASP
jgi:glycine hydroxymethyltransferase